MFVGITNTPRDNAWGSDGEISALLGKQPTGRPEAELWLGAHPASPSRILDPKAVGGATDLAEWIAADPRTALGAGGEAGEAPRLSFLLKVLAAAQPLSIQAHPSIARARAGFERENRLGIPLDASHRNYKDDNHKPEMILAVSERFEALCGFLPLAASVALFERLIELDSASDAPLPAVLVAMRDRLSSGEDLEGAFAWVLSGGDEVAELVERVSALVMDGGFVEAWGGTEAAALQTAALLAREWPGDPGIVVSLLMNRVTLRRGEALYLPAGNIHAYLEGVGIELMSASDNVLRGGLTPKHVDVAELLTVVDFTTAPVALLESVEVGGALVYRPDIPDFQLVIITRDSTVQPTGPAILLCTSGEFAIRGAGSSVTVRRGDAVFITPDEGELRFEGSGEVFLATAQ